MSRYGRTKAAKPVSVAVKLDDKPDEAWPLLEHLAAQNYEQLQVVVLVRNKATLTALRRYQRRNRTRLMLSVVSLKHDADARTVLKRYTKGDALLWLTPQQRLTPGFLRRVAAEFLVSDVDAVLPHRALQPGDSLVSAFRALNVVAGEAIPATLAGRQPLVYRRSAYFNDSAGLIRRTGHAAIITPAAVQHRAGDGSWVAFGILSFLVFAGVLSLLLLPQGWELVLLTAAGGWLLVMSHRLIEYPYTLGTTFSLLLLLPYWPIVGSVGLLRQPLHYVRSNARSRRLLRLHR